MAISTRVAQTDLSRQLNRKGKGAGGRIAHLVTDVARAPFVTRPLRPPLLQLLVCTDGWQDKFLA